jgi:hypothetical protein
MACGFWNKRVTSPTAEGGGDVDRGGDVSRSGDVSCSGDEESQSQQSQDHLTSRWKAAVHIDQYENCD